LKKSKIRLLFNLTIIFLSIYNIFSFIQFNNNYVFNNHGKVFTGSVLKVDRYEDYSILYIKGKEKIKGYLHCKNNIQIGDKIKITYSFKGINQNYNFYSFNYNTYLKGLNISKVVNIKSYKKIAVDNSLIIHRYLSNKINSKKSKAYIKTFINADKTNVDLNIKKSYIDNGIIHLLCISGFHVIFLIDFFKKIFRKITKKESIINFLTIFISFIYLKLTFFSLPLYRAILFYFFNYYNKKYDLKICKNCLYIMVLNIILLNNINYVYLSSFYYTFIICFFLTNIHNFNLTNKPSNILSISIYIFIITIPLNIYFNHYINLLSILLNILFSWFICYIFFPLSFLSIILSFFDSIYYLLIKIFEITNLYINRINIFKISFPHISIYKTIILYLIIFLLIKFRKRIFLIIVILLLLFYKISVYFDGNTYIYFLDVGQGDMSVIVSSYHKNATVIDTGGNENSNYLFENIHNFLISIGVSRINNLIITHGDADHMGEAINLVDNFKVEKVIFNCGEFNELEQDLIKVLDKKKIPYYSCIKELNIDNNKLYFLQTKEYDNENDNSNVIYTEIDGYKFMFMGDAGVEKERDILDKYNLSDIDVLKVGHHGSKTSSSGTFINEMNPKYSIISVGKNNRYGHPNKEVLNNLNNSTIYRTDQDGSIMFKIKNNKLKIENCSPYS